ncbi:hypothetical protein EV383_1625 [Pseudonocardia sediminis]|uniref:DUF4439 domain-containing protein n=2 Tax=Pseudonocardia sediminis TaxID=1397368 RepID=A0A4V2FQH3_PSEST|nr:hypothetical protein EV383_1625 [Pseudonocardia sediminis]
MRDVCDVPASAGITRRRMLTWCAAAAVAPPVLTACTSGSGTDADDSRTLLALADQARADAALVVAAVTADPALAERLEPLRAARIDHAAALDTAGGRTAASAVTPPAPDTADVARVRDAVVSSARAASDAVPQAPATQVGLLAEIAACCTTYGVVLA